MLCLVRISPLFHFATNFPPFPTFFQLAPLCLLFLELVQLFSTFFLPFCLHLVHLLPIVYLLPTCCIYPFSTLTLSIYLSSAFFHSLMLHFQYVHLSVFPRVGWWWQWVKEGSQTAVRDNITRTAIKGFPKIRDSCFGVPIRMRIYWGLYGSSPFWESASKSCALNPKP